MNVLDIGSCNTKILCSKRVFGRQKNEIANIIKTPESLIYDGLICEPKYLYKELQKYINKIKDYSEKIAVSVSSSQTKSKIIKTNKKSMEEEVYKLKNANSNYISDYKIISKQGENISMLQVCIPKIIIENYIEFFNIANLKCQKIDFIGNALSKIKLASNEGTTAIVDIGGRNTNVIIQKDGTLEDYRMFAHGGASMTGRLAEALGIDINEAEKIKIKNGISPNPRRALKGELSIIDAALKSDIDMLLQELQSYFNLYVMMGRERKDIEQITLVGGGSLLRNLDEYIMRKLSVPTFRYPNDNEAIFAVTEGVLRR